MTDGEISVGGITVRLTRTGKQLFGGNGISKGDLIEYYLTIAPRILPYLRERPLAMRRYPDGIAGQAIVQKNVPRTFPDWITRVEVEKQGGTVCQVVCDKPATLVYLANQASIELHVFLSQLGALDRPDQLVFDLDPADAGQFGQACRTALALRRLLTDELGLAAYVKTTGGKGLHVHVPLRAEEHFDSVRAFARQAADLLASRDPGRLTTEQRRQERDGRLYLDVMRNAYAQLAIAPYSARGRPGAPVATPLHWDEVEDGGPAPGQLTIRTTAARLARIADPWAGMTRHRRGLAGPRRRLDALSR
ncbi:MAG: non-homologous end-joining DNA ligase [Streptosporangiaceae bacterium]|nr:non-homologous end-joining DNA ligase [Streptosporangiaceae bacterium]